MKFHMLFNMLGCNMAILHTTDSQGREFYRGDFITVGMCEGICRQISFRLGLIVISPDSYHLRPVLMVV